MFNLLTLLVLLAAADLAYAEGSYLIPEAVDRAEMLSSEAERLGHDGFRPPKSPREAMGRLRRIDHNLERIIYLGNRFQKTTHMLERGLNRVASLHMRDRHFIHEWGAVIEGNYHLMQEVMIESRRTDIRAITAMKLLEDMKDQLEQRIDSQESYRRIAITFSNEARTIEMARDRLHQQLIKVKYKLSSIRRTAEKRR